MANIDPEMKSRNADFHPGESSEKRGVVDFLVLRWSQLFKLRSNKAISSSYIWLIIVPVSVKLLSEVENPITITALGQGITINTELPFSWNYLYLCAFFGMISNILVSIRCPDINRFRSFGDYERSGLGVRFLRAITRRRGLFSQLSENHAALLQKYEPGDDFLAEGEKAINRSSFFSLYWAIYYACSRSTPVERAIASALYYVAFVFLIVVFIQNALYVFRQFQW